MLTAGLPLYNCPKAAPIQLLSLCEQIDAPEWELIVCEEQTEQAFGRGAVAEYAERLKAANCVRVLYLALDRWAPLSEKWLLMIDHMAEESIGFTLCGSDDYSPPHRIESLHRAMSLGHDWAHYERGPFYNVETGEAAVFDMRDRKTGLLQCIAAENAKAIKPNKGAHYPKSGVDSWTRQHARAKNPIVLKGFAGVHTDGVNTLSLNRRKLYANGKSKGMFSQADPVEVFNMFSESVQKYIKTLKK